jgi:hypothetical protein
MASVVLLTCAAAKNGLCRETQYAKLLDGAKLRGEVASVGLERVLRRNCVMDLNEMKDTREPEEHESLTFASSSHSLQVMHAVPHPGGTSSAGKKA